MSMLFARLLRGYAWLWVNAFEAMVGLALAAIVLFCIGSVNASAIAWLLFMVIVLITLRPAWFYGEHGDFDNKGKG